jgi:hypothetical protein
MLRVGDVRSLWLSYQRRVGDVVKVEARTEAVVSVLDLGR